MTKQCEICTSTIPVADEVCPVCGMPHEGEGSSYREEKGGRVGPWTIVRTVSTVIEAELMAGRLRNEGIPAVVLSQVDSTRNLTVGALAIAKVYVPAVDYAQADAILSVDADEENDFGSDGDLEE